MPQLSIARISQKQYKKSYKQVPTATSQKLSTSTGVKGTNNLEPTPQNILQVKPLIVSSFHHVQHRHLNNNNNNNNLTFIMRLK